MGNRGLTFLEILITLIIFTIAMLGFFRVFNVALIAQQRARQEVIAINLARGLAAEAMSKNFTDPVDGETGALGPNSGESLSNRQTFDDVDDYNGYSDSPPVTLGGQAMNVAGGLDYSGFSRSVNVVYCNVIGNYINCPVATPPLPDYKRARVTVNSPYAKNIVIDEVKGKPVP